MEKWKWSLGNKLDAHNFSIDEGDPDDPPEPQQDHEDQEQESVPQDVAEKHATKRQKRFHQSVPCNQCGKTFFNTDSLKRHVEDLHRQTSNGLKKCDQCDYACKNSRNMKYHVQGVHEGKVWPCKLCDFEAKHKGTLIAHIKRKHEGMEYEFPTGKRVVKKWNSAWCPKKYKCEKCDFQAGDKNYLKDHVKSIHDGDPYKCEKCPRTFNFVGRLNAHYREIHDRVTFPCEFLHCRKVFALEQLLQIHYYEKHVKVFKKCKECDEKFINLDSLHSHFHIHIKNNEKCPKCGKIIKHSQIKKEEEREGRQYLKQNHSDHKDFKVENENLKQKKVDLKHKPVILKYPCHICDYEFCDQSSLKKHIVLHLNQSKN